MSPLGVYALGDAALGSAAVISDTDPLQFDGGYLRVYGGTQPASVDVAISTQTLLAELRFNTPAFGAEVNGTRTGRTLIGDGRTPATGIATFFRAFRNDGTTGITDGTVGKASGDLQFNTTTMLADSSVTVSTLTYALGGDLSGTGLVLPQKGTRHHGAHPFLSPARRTTVRR